MVSFAERCDGGRVGGGGLWNGGMDAGGTRIWVCAVGGWIADDDGCFGAVLAGDVRGCTANFGADGKNLFAGICRSRGVADGGRGDCAGQLKPKLLPACAVAALQIGFCGRSDWSARDCGGDKQVRGFWSRGYCAESCKDFVCGDPACVSFDPHYNFAGRGLPDLAL